MKTPRRSPTGRMPPQPNLQRRLRQSKKGRLKFQPGDKHTLDDQLKEARNYRLLIAEQISQLRQVLADLGDLSQLDEQTRAEDEALKTFLWDKYREHKHRDHILATFLIARRKHRLERLQAAEAATRLLREFLVPDDALLQELQQAIELMEAQQPPQRDREGPEESRINYRRIGDPGTTKARMTDFDEEVRQMRAAISQGTGWFEVFWIEKFRLTREARQYMKQGKEIPESVALFEPVMYGPYLKYRWREEGNAKAPIYTIQMSLVEDEVAEEEEEQPPWPNL
jgi:hypothetical protein